MPPFSSSLIDNIKNEITFEIEYSTLGFPKITEITTSANSTLSIDSIYPEPILLNSSMLISSKEKLKTLRQKDTQRNELIVAKNTLENAILEYELWINNTENSMYFKPYEWEEFSDYINNVFQ